MNPCGCCCCCCCCIHLQDLGPFDAVGLSELSRLTQLQSLALLSTTSLEDVAPDLPRRWRFIPHLTALTALDISLSRPDDVAKLGGCTSLVSLVVKGVVPPLQLQPSTWEAVGTLTRLTELQLWVVDHRFDTLEGFASAVTQLTRLEVFACESWTDEVLPVLQGLPALTDVLGYWWSLDGEWPGKEEAERVTLPQVRTLSAAGGWVPFKAFPKLEEFGQRRSLTTDAVASVGECCPDLREWWLDDDTDGKPQATCLEDEPLRSCVAAVQSLTALQRLTRMEVSLSCNAEVFALVPTAEQLLQNGSLQRLRVLVVDDSEPYYVSDICTSFLVYFGRLSGLRQLQLELQHSADMFGSVSEGAALLGAFGGCAKVSIRAAHSHLRTLELAQSWLQDSGLGVPSVELVSVDDE